ncbi:MAG: ROK family protein [Thermoguttaceae bacterium]
MNILSIDIGGSKIMAAETVVQNAQIEFGNRSFRTISNECRQSELLDLIYEVVGELGTIEFERVGITVPGLADPKRGLWVYACFSGIQNFPIVSLLSEFFQNRPIFIENDVNACALAEKKFGKGRDLSDFLWMTISNGIGGGLVLDGNIYSGAFGCAGEIGHFSVVDSVKMNRISMRSLDIEPPFQCGCGNWGCLEAEAAGPGISRRYKSRLEALSKRKQAQLKSAQINSDSLKKVPSSDLSAESIAELARSGDEIALSVWEKTGELIGKSVAYAVNLLNLEAVFFGGGVVRSFDLLKESLEKSVQSRLFSSANRSIRLETTALGYDAALMGAAAIALLKKDV